MKKFVVFLLALSLVSCGSKTEQSDSGNKKMTIFALFNGKALDPEWPVYKKAKELTGVELENIASKNQTDEIQAYNLMLTSKKLPDIVSSGISEELENLGIEGGLIPLEDLIKKYAPHIQKFFDENPRYLKDATAVDGHIYMIPNYSDYFKLRTSQAYFIRKDWLKKLNLKEPKTIEDFHNVLIAFRDKDPNGNGKKDEIPLFERGAHARAILMALSDIFKASPIWYDKNGTPVYGPSQPEYRQAIKELAKWYKEGLIDPEIFTRGLKARDYMLSNDLGGATIDWIVSTVAYNEQLKDKVKGIDFSAILPLDMNGDNSTKFSRRTYQGGWGISKDAKDPIEVIKYFDFWYTEEGRRLWNFGIEGDDYVMENGEPKFTDKILKNPEGKNPLAVLALSGAQYRLGMFQDSRYELGVATQAAKDAIKLYMDSNVIKGDLATLKYTKDESKEFVTIDAALRSFVEEKSQQWILGSSDVDADWDAYIKRLNELGLKKAEEIQKTAYDRFNK